MNIFFPYHSLAGRGLKSFLAYYVWWQGRQLCGREHGSRSCVCMCWPAWPRCPGCQVTIPASAPAPLSGPHFRQEETPSSTLSDELFLIILKKRLRTSENGDAIYEVKKRPFLTISLFAHRSLCFPMAILKCNLKLCKTNSNVKLDWENLIRFVGALPIIEKQWPCKLYCILSHRPNFLDFNDCLLLFATFYVSLGARGRGRGGQSRLTPRKELFLLSVSISSS